MERRYRRSYSEFRYRRIELRYRTLSNYSISAPRLCGTLLLGAAGREPAPLDCAIKRGCRGAAPWLSAPRRRRARVLSELVVRAAGGKVFARADSADLFRLAGFHGRTQVSECHVGATLCLSYRLCLCISLHFCFLLLLRQGF